MQSRQVFFDPSGRRRRIMNVVGVSVFAALAAALAIVAAGLLIPPELPVLENKSAKLPTLADASGERAAPWAGPSFEPFARSYAPPSARAAKRYGFFEMFDRDSHGSLRRNVHALDAMLANFLVLGRSDGELALNDPNVEDRLRAWLKREAPGLEVYPVLSSDNRPAASAPRLASPAARSALVQTIARYLEKNGDAGIALAFSDLPPASHGHLLSLAKDLRQTLRPAGRKVILIASVAAEKSQLQAMAQAADYVLITLHQTFQPGAPGPASSQAWFETQLRRLRGALEPGKLIVGLGSFGYDWGAPKSPVVSVESAWSLMRNAAAPMAFDSKALNPRFRYTEPGGVVHDVWLLDGVTVFNQMKAALMARPAGLALWRLGAEDQSVWASFARGREPDAAALSNLALLPGRLHLDPRASRAEVISGGRQANQVGARTFAYDQSLGLIVQESIRQEGGDAGLAVWKPADPMQIALTFDDGPDEKITPKILDALAQKSVQATFFVVGRNALLHPGVIRRMYNEGHDLGNHTFSHARLAALSKSEFEIELNSMQRTLELFTGVHTTLFRPPYTTGMAEPESLPMVEGASRLGYVTVLAEVDSLDWTYPQLSPQRIHDTVLTQVLGGRGQIVVFHDWGKKNATVEALPRIIDSLRERGFSLVTVHELIGRTRSDVMPTAASVETVTELTGKVRRSTMLALNAARSYVPWLAALGGVLAAARYIFVLAAAARHRRLERQRGGAAYDPIWRPASVAVIVPAYNEEKVICKTIASILASPILASPIPASDEADFEIIVVDDGSSDRTAQAVRDAYAGDERVKVFVKANGGKASASNFGLSRTSAEVVVCLDADTLLAPDAISLLVRHFADPTVGAVAGTAIVGNEINLLTRFQAFEYRIGQYLDRRAFALFNAMAVVPGAIGAWRRKALLDVGGYAHNTVAEDADATFSMTRAGWKVLYEPLAEARTEAPEDVRGFLKQRHRWMFGMLQVVTKHAAALFSRPNGIGWVTIPNTMFLQFGFSLFMPVIDLLAVVGLLGTLHGWLAVATPAAYSGVSEYLAWWLAFLIMEFVLTFVAMKIADMRGFMRIAPLIVLQRFLYWPLIYFTGCRTLAGALKGRLAGWNKLLRTGAVQVQQPAAGGGAA